MSKASDSLEKREFVRDILSFTASYVTILKRAV